MQGSGEGGMAVALRRRAVAIGLPVELGAWWGGRWVGGG